MRSTAFGAALLAASVFTVSAAPVADALQRPALMVRAPAQAVLLGAAWAAQRIVAVGERGIVVVSDDGGQSWRQKQTPVSVSLTAVRFADAKHGVAIGHGGTVLTTADGGTSWERRLDGKQAAQLTLAAARASGDAAQVKAAERLVADGADKPFFDVVMFDAQRLLVVGAYGLAFLSEDGGARWAPWMTHLDNPKALHLYAARQRDGLLLIAGEQGLLLRSTDGGKSFQRVPSPYRGSFFTAELSVAGDMVVAGMRGNAWHSADRGDTWTQISAAGPSSLAASALAADGAVLLANQAGVVMRLEGDALVPINRAPLPMPSSLLPDRHGHIFAFGIAGVNMIQGSGQ